MIQDLAITLLMIGYAVGVLLTFGTVLTWVERKQPTGGCHVRPEFRGVWHWPFGSWRERSHW